jgi:putative membrane protein
MRVASFSRFVPISLALLFLMLAAGLAQAADATSQQPLNTDEQTFLTRAANDNATQIAMAKLALAKSNNPRVIDLANSIIQERTTLSQRMAQLLPGNAHSKQAADDNPMVTRMQTLDGDAFDKTFASSAVRSHCRLISAYQAMKLTSTNPALKDFANSAIPALRGNLTVALTVLRSSGWMKKHQEAVASVETHNGSKAPVFWEPISLVAAPW